MICRTESVINYCFIITCLSGCLYQLYSVTTQYLEYAVIFQFEIKRPGSIQIPDISYCVSYEGAFNFTLFYGRNHNLVKNTIKLNKRFGHFKSFNQTRFKRFSFLFGEFMNAMFISYSVNRWEEYLFNFEDIIKLKFVNDPKLMDSTKRPVSYRKRLSVKSPTEICYTVQFYGNYTYSYNEITARAAYSGMMAGIEIDMDLTLLSLTKQVLFHKKGTQPRNLMHPYFIKRKNDSVFYNGYDLTFQRYITHFLPDPFTTHCEDYIELGFENRDHALDECAYGLSVKKMNSLCCHLLIDLNETLIVKNFSSLNDCTKEKLEIELYIMRECEKRYPKQDCYSVKMVPIENKAFVIEDSKDYYHFFVYAPLDDDFITSTQPSMRLIDYLIYTGSAVGFWFGISLLKFINQAKQVFAHVAVKFVNSREFNLNVIQNQNLAVILNRINPNHLWRI